MNGTRITFLKNWNKLFITKCSYGTCLVPIMCYRPDVPPEQFQINVPAEHLVGRKKDCHVPPKHLIRRDCCYKLFITKCSYGTCLLPIMCYRPDVPPEQFQINVPSEHLIGRDCQSDVPPEQFQINVPSEHLIGRDCLRNNSKLMFHRNINLVEIANPMFLRNNSKLMFHRNIWSVEIANPMFLENNSKLMFHRNIWSVEIAEFPCSIGTFGE
ncbi:MAG: hypothetical protein JWR05_1491 [Mucilaginibacter sp.]|nr:hypothetical protein [Mucilaginibacter sp.]